MAIMIGSSFQLQDINISENIINSNEDENESYQLHNKDEKFFLSKNICDFYQKRLRELQKDENLQPKCKNLNEEYKNKIMNLYRSGEGIPRLNYLDDLKVANENNFKSSTSLNIPRLNYLDDLQKANETKFKYSTNLNMDDVNNKDILSQEYSEIDNNLTKEITEDWTQIYNEMAISFPARTKKTSDKQNYRKFQAGDTVPLNKHCGNFDKKVSELYKSMMNEDLGDNISTDENYLNNMFKKMNDDLQDLISSLEQDLEDCTNKLEAKECLSRANESIKTILNKEL